MAARLPPELWRSIFREATYVPDLLSTSWDYDPEDRIWESWFGEKLDRERNLDEQLDTKRAIVQVCREWRTLGTEFLYEVIQIRPNLQRSPQLYTLIKTLTASNLAAKAQPTTGSASYGWWTKRITFHPSHSPDNTFDQLFALLDQCHNLEIFSISTSHNLPEVTHLRLLRLLESRFSHSLRRFDNYLYAEGSHYEVTPKIPGLMSLGVIMRNGTPNPLDNGASFKRITTLTLHSLSLLQSQEFPSEWYFPSLMNLSLWGPPTHRTNALIPFVKRHRHTLRHLHISTVTPRKQPLPNLLDLLSGVQHLRSLSLHKVDLDSLGVLRTSGYIPYQALLPELTYLGITYDPSSGASELWTNHCLERVLGGDIFPELRAIRVLSPTNFVSGLIWSEIAQRSKIRGIRFENRRGHAIDGENSDL